MELLSRNNVEVKEKDIYIPSPTVDMKIIVLSVNKIFQENRFDICAIRSIRDVFNLKFTRKDLENKLRLLNCVDYADMEKDVFDFCVQ